MRRNLPATLFAALVLALIVLRAADVTARTWRVEKDGSGDFTVIQEAVDVAASGDTVRIGVGRFDDKRYFTCPGWSDSVRVVVHQYELTVLGSGSETIIGQEVPWELDQGDHKGIVASDGWGNAVVNIQSIRFENMGTGIYTSYETYDGSQVEIRDCSFATNHYALTLISIDVGGEVLIEDCVFDGMARDGTQAHCWNQDKFTMRRCTSRLAYDPPWTRVHFGAVGVDETLIESCEFIGGSGVADFTYGGPALIRDCRFEGQNILAIGPGWGSDVTLERCIFENQERGLQSFRSSNVVSVRHCQFVNVGDCSFRLLYVGQFIANENDIARGERGAVLIDEIPDCTSPRTLDFTDNYWYTGDPDSIAAWIHDRNDSDQACYYVDFEPFRDVSTPVDQNSLSEVKALFR